MKIYLTEMEEQGKKYAGPNIVAPNLKEAEEAAQANGLILIGEFTDIYVTEGLMPYSDDEPITDRILH